VARSAPLDKQQVMALAYGSPFYDLNEFLESERWIIWRRVTIDERERYYHLELLVEPKKGPALNVRRPFNYSVFRRVDELTGALNATWQQVAQEMIDLTVKALATMA
jgi:hypothetical protein